MAPRETRVESQSFALLSGAAAQKLLESTKPAAGPEVRRAPREEKPPKPVEPSAASVATAVAGQVVALVSAAANGAAFCEDCEREAKESESEAETETPDDPNAEVDDGNYAAEEESESESEASAES